MKFLFFRCFYGCFMGYNLSIGFVKRVSAHRNRNLSHFKSVGRALSAYYQRHVLEYRHFFSKLVNTQAYDDNELLLEAKVTTLNFIMLLMSGVLTSFCILRYQEGNLIQAYADALLLLITIICFILLRKNRGLIKQISRVLILFASLAAISLILSAPEVDTRFVWLNICIYMMFFLLDIKEGLIWFTTTFILLMALYLGGLIVMGFSEFFIFIFSLSLFAFLLSRYEKIKSDNQRYYQSHNKMLKDAVKEKTSELMIQKNMFESLFQQSYDGLLLIESGKFIECNDAIVSMLGYDKKEELLNTHPSELSPQYQPDGRLSREKAEECMAVCLDKGSHKFEWLHTRASGENFWCDVSLTHLRLSDRDLIHVIWRDITQQKALERENQKINENLEAEVDKRTQELELAMRAKSDFLANMSHEIRTPLNAMLGFVTILEKEAHDAKQRQYLDIVHNSGETLLAIINDILDFSKIDSGQLEIELLPFEIKKLFEELQMLFFEKAKEKEITIEISFGASLPHAGRGDVLRIKQVVSNFLSNAIKFTPEAGFVGIDISYSHKDATLSCKVTDTGIGIDDKNRDKIFNAFSQEDSSTTRKYGGTGLGLTISKRLIEIMGGSIGVESSKGEGSRFFFTLPCPVSDELLAQSIEDGAGKDAKEMKGKILIVEDNKTNQLFVQIMLSELGLKSDIAENGVEALAQLEKSSYDLILMDENMPVMNGIEATKEIRKRRIDTPIIAVTANALKGDREKFLDSGMNDYISKPIKHKLFVKLLQKYLA